MTALSNILSNILRYQWMKQCFYSCSVNVDWGSLCSQDLQPIMDYFVDWEVSRYREDFEGFPSARDIPPTTTIEDMKTAIRGVTALAERAVELGQGLCPHRINQDAVENFFGYQRGACGANTNMTGTIDKTVNLDDRQWNISLSPIDNPNPVPFTPLHITA